jgi:P4 family phage/plasmid primase-like protien
MTEPQDGGNSPLVDPDPAVADPSRMVVDVAVRVLLQYAGLQPGEVPGTGRLVTVAEAEAEVARRGIAVAIPEKLPAPTAEEAAGFVAGALRLGAHLLPLRAGRKEAIEARWPTQPAMSPEAAAAHLVAGGNLGINLGASRMIALDGEQALATDALIEAGFVPATVTAKAQDPTSPKFGGAHVLLAAPEGIDVSKLRVELGVKLGGGTLDALTGAHYVVAPGSRIDEAPGYQYRFAADGPMVDPAVWRTAPAWLLDPAEAAPTPGVEPLRGVFAPRVRRERIPNPNADELTAAIDSIPWSEWLAGAEARVPIIGEDGGCGCDVFHFAGAETLRSGILHDGCEFGYGAHAFSGTLQAAWGREHGSRLQFAAWVRGVSERELAAQFGIQLHTPLGVLTAEYFDADAARLEAAAAEGVTSVGGPPGPAGAVVIRVEVGRDGLLARAAGSRRAAASMRAAGAEEPSAWGVHGSSTGTIPIAGGVPPVPPQLQRPAAPVPGVDGATALRPEMEEAGAGAVVLAGGLPMFDPMLPMYIKRAEVELAAPPAEIDCAPPLCKYLLPADLRSLRATVFGPRATPAPADVEFSDGQLAQAVAAAVGGTKLIYASDGESWFGWDGDRFKLDSTAAQEAVQALLQRHRQASDPAVQQRKIRAYSWKRLTVEAKERLARTDARYSFSVDGALVTEDGREIEMVTVEVAERAESTTTRNAIIAQLGATPSVKVLTEELDAHPQVVGVKGGYLNLADPELKVPGPAVTITPPDPTNLVTKLMGASFDPAATCRLWEQSLVDALPFEEVRQWLQKLAGSAMFGRQVEHIAAVFSGLGGNGKGCTTDVLVGMYGDYAAVLQTSVLTLAGMNNHATDLMPLRGARLATSDEVPPQQLYTDRLKKITGGGPLGARLCGQNQTTWDQSHTLILLTNNKLQWPPSAMAAMRRRLRVIKFDVEFGVEGGPPMIPGLAKRILATEASGVLNWMIEGYRMYCAEGLAEPDTPQRIKDWTSDACADSSSWASFCDAAFEVTRNASDALTSAEIFKVWDFFRGQDTDQKHASPGSVRVVAGMVVEQLRGVGRIEAGGKVKAAVTRVKWSTEGLALVKESQRAATPYFPSPLGVVHPKPV